jgi:serine/threonine protein kinase
MPEWNVPGCTELKRLGSGRFAEVVLARHDGSGTLVAIKYLHRDLLSDPLFAAMFRAEAEVLAALQDPNVVQLYEYVESTAGAAAGTLHYAAPEQMAGGAATPASDVYAATVTFYECLTPPPPPRQQVPAGRHHVHKPKHMRKAKHANHRRLSTARQLGLLD